ncbi:MAG: hypothetical protein GEV08_02750 [Acidimicrobiia bacterium]|nr:hypothetical protein [Acidimicrobiia bacterium]
MRRLRYLLLRSLVLRTPRRWLYYTAATMAWRWFRRLTGTQPEVVYRASLRRGERFDLLTDKPLPKRFQTRRRRRRVAAAARAELRSLR